MLQHADHPLGGPDLKWAVTSVQPIPGRDGYYYAAARVAYPAPPLGGFSVDFVWLGTGTPGSQEFEIFGDYDRYLVANGVTTPVPEPASAGLLVVGLLGMVWLRRR